MATSWLASGVAGATAVGLAGVVYLLLVAVAAVMAIFSGKKVRRDAALEVLRTLLPSRQQD